jgi:hypothetical protein
MGVSLSYRVEELVNPDVVRTILDETNRLRGEYDWWCEPIIFFEMSPPAERGRRLAGDTKLFLDSWTSAGVLVEVEHTDEYETMVRRDTMFVLERLRKWSERYGLRWILEMADADYGEIAAGKVSSATLETFARDGIDVVSPFDEEKARKISEKYSSRGRFSPR